MKLSKKILSVLLAILMAATMASAAFAGVLKTDSYKTVETLIASDSLAEVAGELITSINDVKTHIAGTVLRLVFTFVKNDDLSAIIGDRNVSQFTDDEAAAVLIKWTDKLLKDNTKSLTENDTYNTVVNAIRIATFGRAKIDLSTTKKALNTVYTLGGMKAVLNLLGDAKDLNVSALKGVESKSDLDTLYAVIQFLKDNIKIIKKAVRGKIDLGIGALNDAIKDPMEGMKNLPLFLKSYIYLLIDGHAAAGEFNADQAKAKGDWGNSAYADYSADQMLAAALIRLMNDNEEVVSKEDTDAALTLSFYDLLTTYAPGIFNKYAIPAINDNLPGFIQSISVTKEIKAVFKAEIPAVTEETIADLLEEAKTTGILGQVNNVLVRLADLIMEPAACAKLGLVAGGNENLNANLDKLCRLILPLMANKTVSDNLGFDFTEFTAANIKGMDLPQMAVAVLKLFFGYWFDNNPNYDPAVVDAAKSPEQLAVLAVYYTATHTGWLNLDYDFTPFVDRIFADGKLQEFDRDTANDLMAGMGIGIGYGALKYNAATVNYFDNLAEAAGGEEYLLGDIDKNGEISSADARLALRGAVGLENYEPGTIDFLLADADKDNELKASDARLILRCAVGLEEFEETVKTGSDPTWQDYADDISDWALNYVKGMPAII